MVTSKSCQTHEKKFPVVPLGTVMISGGSSTSGEAIKSLRQRLTIVKVDGYDMAAEAGFDVGEMSRKLDD